MELTLFCFAPDAFFELYGAIASSIEQIEGGFKTTTINGTGFWMWVEDIGKFCLAVQRKA